MRCNYRSPESATPAPGGIQKTAPPPLARGAVPTPVSRSRQSRDLARSTSLFAFAWVWSRPVPSPVRPKRTAALWTLLSPRLNPGKPRIQLVGCSTDGLGSHDSQVEARDAVFEQPPRPPRSTSPSTSVNRAGEPGRWTAMLQTFPKTLRGSGAARPHAAFERNASAASQIRSAGRSISKSPSKPKCGSILSGWPCRNSRRRPPCPARSPTTARKGAHMPVQLALRSPTIIPLLKGRPGNPAHRIRARAGCIGTPWSPICPS